MPTVVSGGKSFRRCRCRFHQERSEKCRVSEVADEGFFRSKQFYLQYVPLAGRPARIGIGRHSGFFWEVEADIGRRPGSVRSREEFRDS